jgi:hypothetical protein
MIYNFNILGILILGNIKNNIKSGRNEESQTHWTFVET